MYGAFTNVNAPNVGQRLRCVGKAYALEITSNRYVCWHYGTELCKAEATPQAALCARPSCISKSDLISTLLGARIRFKEYQRQIIIHFSAPCMPLPRQLHLINGNCNPEKIKILVCPVKLRHGDCGKR